MSFFKEKWKEIVEVIAAIGGALLFFWLISDFKMNCPEEPYDVWVKDRNIFVVMEKGGNILQYSFDGELLWSLGSKHYPKERIPTPLKQDN
jgi:hypothetical protein